MTKLRVFLTDDHTVVREGLKRIVESEADMKIVGEAHNGREAIAAVHKLKPDIVIMDMSMPELNGAQTTRLMLKANPGLIILILTVHEDKSYVRELLEAGAMGYVLKRTAGDELIRAIRTVVARNIYVDPRLAGPLLNSFVLRPEKSARTDIQLSQREEEVLRRLADGYSNKQIAAQLNVSVKTVETYKARSMEKLGLRSRVDLVRHATRLGWLGHH